MVGLKYRVQAVVFAVAVFVTVYPQPASALTPVLAPQGCIPLLIPEEIVDEFEDLLANGTLCVGERLKAESEESRSRLVTEDATVRERTQEHDVRRPLSDSFQTAPRTEEIDADELEQLGFKVKKEESRVVYETEDSRFEERSEETKVEGDNFRYKSEESRTHDETEDTDERSRETDEKFRSTNS
jgi:hypothetical protein